MAVVVAALALPPDLYPLAVRERLDAWFGADTYRPRPASMPTEMPEHEPPCPPDLAGSRDEQQIDGVTVRASRTCVADDPAAVAAFVLGTNRVSADTLMASGLAPDAVVKGRDLDGDGDPDEIDIRLEVVELNGGSPDSTEPVTQFAIAPGIRPGFWVFAPKTVGMATVNFESVEARAMLRPPSPTIRVEQGDRVTITLENGHYLPHTIHFHGVDHPFRDADGEGNDGVPITSEMPVMPGAARTYDMTPRQPGTMFYHCHVQPHVHIMMGLQGLFVVEENRPANRVQTLNVGAGHVRAPSAAVREDFAREYDLHYLDLDVDLNNLIQRSNDPRQISEWLHRRYNITQANAEFFLLNGRSFPYTFRESLVVAAPDERIKLRVANGGSQGVALHTHGHKATITHYDGVPAPPAAQITRDVVWIAAAQRVDLTLETTNDGLHSYGPGVWLLHDHQERGVTNNGMGPGGNVSAIVYESYLRDNGWPLIFGMKWDRFFTEAYWRGELPVFSSFSGVLQAEGDPWRLARLVAFAFACGVALATVVFALGRRRRGGTETS